MIISDYFAGGYLNGYVCNSCRRSAYSTRWVCLECHDDYCFKCAPRPTQSIAPRVSERLIGGRFSSTYATVRCSERSSPAGLSDADIRDAVDESGRGCTDSPHIEFPNILNSSRLDAHAIDRPGEFNRPSHQTRVSSKEMCVLNKASAMLPVGTQWLSSTVQRQAILQIVNMVGSEVIVFGDSGSGSVIEKRNSTVYIATIPPFLQPLALGQAQIQSLELTQGQGSSSLPPATIENPSPSPSTSTSTQSPTPPLGYTAITRTLFVLKGTSSSVSQHLGSSLLTTGKWYYEVQINLSHCR